jgi:rubrerythrin
MATSKKVSEQDGEQKAEQSGTSTEQSEQTTEQHGLNTEQHGERNLGTDETLLKRAVQWRTQGKTYREIENGLGVPKSSLHGYLKRTLPNMKLEQQTDPELDEIPVDGLGGETEEIHEDSHSTPPSFSRPGGIELLEEDRASIRKLVSKTAHGPLEVIWDNAATRQRQRMNNNGHNNNGHDSHRVDDSPLTQRELIQFAQTQKLLDSLTPTKPTENLTEDKIERIVERAIQRSEKGDPVEKALKTVGELYDKASQSHQEAQNPWQIAQSIISLTKEQAQFAHGNTNEFDIKNTEMHQLGKLEEAKLAWEMEKYRDEKGNTSTMINTVKEILAGPAGAILGKIGEAGADRIRGGGKIPTVDVVCPNCSGKFKGNPQLPKIQCPSCGAILEHSQAPQTEQPATPATEPVETTEKAELTEEKPSKSEQNFGFPDVKDF